MVDTKANVCKDLVIPESCSFCSGNSRGTNFSLSLSRDVEVGSGICILKIAIPPVTNELFQSAPLVLWNRGWVAALWVQSQQCFAAMEAGGTSTGQKLWCGLVVLVCVCL